MAQQYKPLFKLDAGGMAEVYVAEAVAMAGFSKKVAIKRILPGLLEEKRFVRMFLDEARLSLRLNHANVVSVFDIGRTDNTYFIVMEYVEGTNLKSLLEYYAKINKPIPVANCIWIVSEILKGLDYAHSLADSQTGRNMGIVHRDISPPNILVSWNAEVKITDFGLAKATTQLEATDPGVVKGKFSYLSPEAARGEQVDHRTDLFAVGILLFELLTLRRLFLGDSDWNTIERVRAARIPNLCKINPEVPPELNTIVHRALAKDPAKRYRNAAEFADALVGLLFDLRMRVSARDVAEMLVELKHFRSKQRPSPSQTQRAPLILDLLNEELTHFQSLEEQESQQSEPRVDMSKEEFQMAPQAYDGSSPLNLELSGRHNISEWSEPALPTANFDDATPTPSRQDTPLPVERHSPRTIPPIFSLAKDSRGGASNAWLPNYHWLILSVVALAAGVTLFFLM